MIKYFCDECDAEITKENQFECQKIKLKTSVVSVAITGSSARDDVVCLHCVIKAVNGLDRRVKAHVDNEDGSRLVL